MSNAYGGLQLAANDVASSLSSTPAKINPTAKWAAIAAGSHGNGSITPVAASGKLTCVPGVYRVSANMTLGSANGAGVVTLQLYKGGVAVAGTKGNTTTTSGQSADVIISAEAIIEVTAADAAASTNYIELYGISSDTFDVLFVEGQLLAVKLD